MFISPNATHNKRKGKPKVTPIISGIVFFIPKLNPEYDATVLFGPGVNPNENEIPINSKISENIQLSYR